MSSVLDLDMELAPAAFPEPDDTAGIAPGIGDESDHDACCPECGRAYLEELVELERLEELRIRHEVAETLARMEAMDAHRQPPPPRHPPAYQPPTSTINAFWYVVRLDDPNYLARWLAQHPLDATALQALWEAKHVVA